MTRALAALTLLLAAACAAPAPEAEVIIVEPALNEAPAPLAKDGIDCTAEAVSGDGIGGTGCPARLP